MRQTLLQKAKMTKGRLQNLIINWRMRLNWFDLSRNLDTGDCIDKEALYDSIDSENKKHMNRYAPTNLTQARKALEYLIRLDASVLHSMFVDFGSGKGRVLVMAEEMGFRNVVGVEFSKQLYQTCQQNLQKAKTSVSRVHLGDAVDFKLSADMRVFYFYNPFEYCIMERVLKNIQTVRTEATRYIIYVDPRQFGKLDSTKYDLLYNNEGPGTPFHIYRLIPKEG